MKNQESMPIGVVLERRRSDHPWQDHSWKAVSLVLGAPGVADWHILYEGEGWVRYYAGTLSLDLHPGETEGYRYNLSQRVPSVYVILRRDEAAADDRLKPFAVTVCPYEVHDYLDSSENHVEGLPMPEAVAAWVKDYADRHHKEVVFQKRKRRPRDGGAPAGSAGGKRGADDGAR